MKPMSVTDNPEPENRVVAFWKALRGTKIVRVIVWARWIIGITITMTLLLWQAYILGQDISENLSTDYRAVAEQQSGLLDAVQAFRDDLLNPNVSVDLDARAAAIAEQASTTLSAVSALRAPSDRIETAKRGYRDALQTLIAEMNRIRRGVQDAQGLANAIQGIANDGGGLNAEVSRFQGGMWPQLVAAVL